jgi:hypothetical protein
MASLPILEYAYLGRPGILEFAYMPKYPTKTKQVFMRRPQVVNKRVYFTCADQ